MFDEARAQGWPRVVVGSFVIGLGADDWSRWKVRCLRGDPGTPTLAEVWAALHRDDDVRWPE